MLLPAGIAAGSEHRCKPVIVCCRPSVRVRDMLGESAMPTVPAAELDVSVSEIQDWAALAGGAALAPMGRARRSLPGLCLSIAATPARLSRHGGKWPAITDEPPRAARAPRARGRAWHPRTRSDRLETPVEEVFRFWRNLPNLTRVMTNLERITEDGSGRSHWVARGPAGVRWSGTRKSSARSRTR